MSKQNGKIGVTSDNIFPIIKKFLYSDHEIFLREIVSNAVDASQKIKTLSSLGEFKGELGNLSVQISIDEKKKTLTVSDAGIGLTAEDIEKYINQIAFSGAEEFLDKYKDDTNAIIGHFGLGFYSSFMVSKKVEIVSLSHTEGAKAVKWSCDGSPEYTLEDGDRTSRGTDIIMYIDDDNKEFLEEARITTLLNKYCKFLPIEIAFGKVKEWKEDKHVETDKPNIINNTKPAWTLKPAELKDEDYTAFYKDLYPMSDDPLFNIHLNVDYPFNLTGILYFPKLKKNFEMQRNKIQLYSNQVFVTDSVEGIVPEFLTLLHGVIDSPDIPLNVSRSYLQSDGNVKKISSHITKKVADRLADIFKKDRTQFEAKWDDLRLFIQYGMITEEKFYDKAEKFALLKNVDGKCFTFEEYQNIVKDNQTDKDKQLVYLYTTDRDAQYTFIEAAQNKGYDVLVMDGQLDTHFVNHLESKLKDTRFVRVDGDVVEKLIPKDEVIEMKLKDAQKKDLTPVFRGQLPDSADTNFIVSFEALKPEDNPVLITQNEFMRRMKDMSQMQGGGGMDFYGTMPQSYNLVVNGNHPLVEKIVSDMDASLSGDLKGLKSKISTLKKREAELEKSKEGKKEEEVSVPDNEELKDISTKLKELTDKKETILSEFGKQNKMVRQLIDLALLSNNMLKGEDLNRFVKRSIEII